MPQNYSLVPNLKGQPLIPRGRLGFDSDFKAINCDCFSIHECESYTTCTWGWKGTPMFEFPGDNSCKMGLCFHSEKEVPGLIFL